MENTQKKQAVKKRGNTTSDGSNTGKVEPESNPAVATVPTQAIELDEKGEMVGWPEHARGTPEWTAKVRSKYNSRSTAWDIHERPLKLKYKQTLVYQEKYGLSNKEAAKRIGIADGTWSRIRSHKESKEIIALIKEWGDDTERVIKDMMHSEAVHSFENLMFCRDRLLEKGDYADASKLDLKILEGIGFWQKAKDANLNVEAQSITIQIGGAEAERLEGDKGPKVAIEGVDYEWLPSPDADADS